MSAGFIGNIDWARPWLAHLLPAARSVAQEGEWRHALNAAASSAGLRNHLDLPIRFVEQGDLPAGTAYEAFIGATGQVPTRANLHDFFNALVWLTFPKIKVQLNALQATELARVAGGTGARPPPHASRGKLRDAATIFDENAALLVANHHDIIDALRAHRWQDVLLTRRAAYGRDWQVWLFGHALMEKLVAPYKSITAHAWPVIVGDAFFSMPLQEKYERLDAMVAMQLSSGLSTSDFTPLPVLGVPGWWSGQDQAFYEDTAVFRPKRERQSVLSSAG